MKILNDSLHCYHCRSEFVSGNIIYTPDNKVPGAADEPYVGSTNLDIRVHPSYSVIYQNCDVAVMVLDTLHCGRLGFTFLA